MLLLVKHCVQYLKLLLLGVHSEVLYTALVTSTPAVVKFGSNIKHIKITRLTVTNDKCIGQSRTYLYLLAKHLACHKFPHATKWK